MLYLILLIKKHHHEKMVDRESTSEKLLFTLAGTTATSYVGKRVGCVCLCIVKLSIATEIGKDCM